MSGIERIQQKRGRLIGRMREAVTQRRYKLQAEIGRELQSLTTAQLRAELSAERRAYRGLARSTASDAKRKAAACRTKSKHIAERLRERA